MIISTADMRQGQTGIVVQINAGYGLARRLEVMGIRLGVTITKRSAQLLRGPVTIQVGRAELALGYGIAGRILVEVQQ
ncbi:MAG: FeoA family protein [Armatimonadota bacterium]